MIVYWKINFIHQTSLMSKRRIINHHAIWRSLYRDYNISDSRNLIPMEEIREKWLHALFNTLLEPHKQFEYINNLWLPIQSKIIKELVKEINTTSKDERYDEWLVK
jgi:DNA polymerase III delta prime subunit